MYRATVILIIVFCVALLYFRFNIDQVVNSEKILGALCVYFAFFASLLTNPGRKVHKEARPNEFVQGGAKGANR